MKLLDPVKRTNNKPAHSRDFSGLPEWNVGMGLPPLPVGLAVMRNLPKQPYGRHWLEQDTIPTYSSRDQGKKAQRKPNLLFLCAKSYRRCATNFSTVTPEGGKVEAI